MDANTFVKLQELAGNYNISMVARKESNIDLLSVFLTLQTVYVQLPTWRKEKNTLALVKSLVGGYVSSGKISTTEANFIVYVMGITKNNKQMPRKAEERIEAYFNAMVLVGNYIESYFAIQLKAKELLVSKKIDDYVYTSVMHSFGMQSLEKRKPTYKDFEALSKFPEYNQLANEMYRDFMVAEEAANGHYANPHNYDNTFRSTAKTNEIFEESMKKLKELAKIGEKHPDWFICNAKGHELYMPKQLPRSSKVFTESELKRQASEIKYRCPLKDIVHYNWDKPASIIRRFAEESQVCNIGTVHGAGMTEDVHGEENYFAGKVKLESKNESDSADYKRAFAIIEKEIDWKVLKEGIDKTLGNKHIDMTLIDRR